MSALLQCCGAHRHGLLRGSNSPICRNSPGHRLVGSVRFDESRDFWFKAPHAIAREMRWNGPSEVLNQHSAPGPLPVIRRTRRISSEADIPFACRNLGNPAVVAYVVQRGRLKRLQLWLQRSRRIEDNRGGLKCRCGTFEH
jgi:hypothetical protein